MNICPRDGVVLVQCLDCGRQRCCSCHMAACPHPLTLQAMQTYYPTPMLRVEDASDFLHLATKTTELDSGVVFGGPGGSHRGGNNVWS